MPLPHRTSACSHATARSRARCWAQRRITPSPAAPATQKAICAAHARKTRRTACAPLPATGASSWNSGPCPRKARRKYGVYDVLPNVSAATPGPALFGDVPLRLSLLYLLPSQSNSAAAQGFSLCGSAVFAQKRECPSRQVQEPCRPYCSAHHAATAACAFFTSRPKIARLFSIFAPGQSF